MVRGGILALALVGVVATAAPAWAETEAPPDSLAEAWEEDVEEQHGWLRRTMHRYFGRAPQSGDQLDGRGEQVVDRYAKYAGLPIDVVIVHPVLRFDEELEEGEVATRSALNRMASRFRSYTKEYLIRQYLLFEPGDVIDPFALADSERMLRQLDFINDARILVLPIEGSPTGVAIVVETRDRWPFGVTGNIITAQRLTASIYTTNLAGHGVRLGIKAIVNSDREPQVGYGVVVSKQNLGGSFIDGLVDFEDSWREKTLRAALNRSNIHPAIRQVGGVAWERRDNRDNEGVPQKYDRSDVWGGRVLQLATREQRYGGRRPTLTPAVSYSRRHHLDRPEVTPDTLGTYHNGRTYLGGLTYQSFADYKTSYLFRMGEVEDLPAGYSTKLSAGYQDGEFHDRAVTFFQGNVTTFNRRGGTAFGRVQVGGYWRTRRMEDGLLDLRLGLITPLLGTGRWQHRFFAVSDYTLGLNRRNENGLSLGNRSGLRGMDDSRVLGDQRLVLQLESRIFTPYALLGFRIMTFIYADIGAIGGEKDPIFKQKFYSSLGLGVRLNNPDLVLPTFEFRFGLIQAVENHGLGFAFKVGNLAYPEIRIPGVRPGTVRYE